MMLNTLCNKFKSLGLKRRTLNAFTPQIVWKKLPDLQLLKDASELQYFRLICLSVMGSFVFDIVARIYRVHL